MNPSGLLAVLDEVAEIGVVRVSLEMVNFRFPPAAESALLAFRNRPKCYPSRRARTAALQLHRDVTVADHYCPFKAIPEFDVPVAKNDTAPGRFLRPNVAARHHEGAVYQIGGFNFPVLRWRRRYTERFPSTLSDNDGGRNGSSVRVNSGWATRDKALEAGFRQLGAERPPTAPLVCGALCEGQCRKPQLFFSSPVASRPQSLPRANQLDHQPRSAPRAASPDDEFP